MKSIDGRRKKGRGVRFACFSHLLEGGCVLCNEWRWDDRMEFLIFGFGLVFSFR